MDNIFKSIDFINNHTKKTPKKQNTDTSNSKNDEYWTRKLVKLIMGPSL